ncbi:MAG: damage-control phosphatase ARMT1 family protein [Polyangiaceae bacterium]
MPRPAPIRTDGSNHFARYSMQVRVPRIARDLLDKNRALSPGQRDAVEALAASIEGDAPLPPPRAPAPDVEAWSAAYAEHAKERWLDGEWFHAELAFYREIAAACRYWETGSDPFLPAKEEELAGERPWARLERSLAVSASREERIARLLDDCLWSNRVDLSYTVAASRETRHDADLLVDERAAALPFLSGPGCHVHLVADNAGAELALDLALTDVLLEDAAARVTLHLKMQPVFVSDAIADDVRHTLAGMERRSAEVRALAARLRGAFEAGRLAFAPDPFWSGPRFLWEAPAHLVRAFGAASLVVFKGDANYRRVVGDAPWPPGAPFREATSYARFPLLCLRTMKSDSVLGLPAGLGEHLDATEPRWRIDGQRGLAQVFVPAPR